MGISNKMAASSMEEFIFDFVDFIWEVNTDGVYTYVAGNVEKVLGYKPEEILGKTPFDLMPEDEAKKISEAFVSIVKNGEPIIDLVNWNRHKDGLEVCLLTNGKPFFSKEGDFLGYRGVDQDITQRHLKEKHLKERLMTLLQWSYSNELGLEKTISKILELSSHGLGADRMSLWLYINEGDALECFDLYESEEKKHCQNDVLYEKDFPLYFKALEKREVLRLEKARTDLRSKEFTQIYLEPNNIYSMLDIPVSTGSELIGVICCEYKGDEHIFNEEDIEFSLAISEVVSKAIEQEHTRKLQKELEETSKKAVSASNAKSDFLSSMSHEIRTPLNAIIGFTSLIQKEQGLSESIQEHLNIIENSSEHLMDVISQVLELSKIEAGKLELINSDFNFQSLLEDVDNMVKMRVEEKGLVYKSSFHAKGTPFVHSDASKLKQVFINLIGNAVKFTQEGFISLDISMEHTEDGFTKVVCVVEDSGRGIAKEKLDTIFEPFMQTDLMDQTQGSGLGLAISKKIIDLMDGKIEVHSEIAKGTSFLITLSLQEAKKEDKVIAFKPVQRLKELENSPKVLVVDDILVNRLLLRTYLEEAGFEVFEAEDGEKAIEVTLLESPDLIWMDLKMPVMDGRRATTLLKEKYDYQGPIFALSANVMNKDSEENEIFDDFLLKPFDENEMFDLMKGSLGIEYIYKQE